MLYPHDLENNVHRGIKWLDENIENWWERINLSDFDMESPCNCVIGQLSPPATDFWDKEENFHITEGQAELLGFDLPYTPFILGVSPVERWRDWDVLQALWVREIRSRKLNRLGNDVY